MAKQKEFGLISHYSEKEGDRKELARRAAVIDAQSILYRLGRLSVSDDRKWKFLDTVIRNEKEKLVKSRRAGGTDRSVPGKTRN